MSDDTQQSDVDVDLEDDDLDEDTEIDDLTDDLGEGDDDAAAGGDAVVADVVADVVEPKAPKAKRRVKKTEEDDDADDLDEELHPDDVETPLDALLKEKTASAKMEDDEDELEDDEPDGDEPVEGTGRIQPRRASEFHCSSCFLLLPRTQLADEERMLCRDCI